MIYAAVAIVVLIVGAFLIADALADRYIPKGRDV